MFWNVFWCLFCLCFAAALGLAGWLTGPGKRKKWKRCTAHTQGTVLRAAALNYGGIHVPLVEYYVDGTAYRIAGAGDGRTVPGSRILERLVFVFHVY